MELARIQKLAGILVETNHQLSLGEVAKINKLLTKLKKLSADLPEQVDQTWDLKQIDKLVDEVLAVSNAVGEITQVTGT